MVIPSLLLVVCGVVIVVGALAELAEAVRMGRAGVTAGSVSVPNRMLGEMDPTRLFTWMGLSGLAVLTPALVMDVQQPVADVALVVVVLGFAAERGAYLSRRFGAAESRPAWKAAIAVLTLAAGVVVALSV